LRLIVKIKGKSGIKKVFIHLKTEKKCIIDGLAEKKRNLKSKIN
jgi:hypothetical protein